MALLKYLKPVKDHLPTLYLLSYVLVMGSFAY